MECDIFDWLVLKTWEPFQLHVTEDMDYVTSTGWPCSYIMSGLITGLILPYECQEAQSDHRSLSTVV